MGTNEILLPVPGRDFITGTVIPSEAVGKPMPSIGCPIIAIIACFPLGVGALIFYLSAKKSEGMRFTMAIGQRFQNNWPTEHR